MPTRDGVCAGRKVFNTPGCVVDFCVELGVVYVLVISDSEGVDQITDRRREDGE